MGGVAVPEVTLTFRLPDEETEARLAQDGGRWKAVVDTMREALRSKRKHGHELDSADAALDWCWDLLHQTVQDEGLSWE